MLKPAGYLMASTEQIPQRVLELVALQGNFEKPRYFQINTDHCAYSQSNLTGCTRCLDVCPADAIDIVKQKISIDAHLCHGAGGCATACPTGAITAPFQLDARRCISYLTIELKGPIPEEFRPAIGNRIYGCDDCLDACPWNRFAGEGRLMAPHRRDDLDQADLVELLALDDDGFRARFRGTPMQRTKRRGVLRNVCVALGNVGDALAIPPLERAAADPEPLIAEHAQWALGQVRQRCRVS